ncbi:MAG: ATP synthase F1 subunit gamma [Candidatus Pacebacteria bacterium]|nr:ATP synthase F1 subunit gamma [Candidatus Paceibacterota bacterium]
MAGSLDIKRRIKSVKNTKKITKAMELVSASKMKRAVSATLASRPYAQASWQILESLSKIGGETEHPLLAKREVKNTLIVLITSNRGLCGAYNAQIIRKVLQIIKDSNNSNISFIAIGKKGEGALRRLGQNIVASFTELPENATLRDVLPIGNLLIQEYMNGTYDKVHIAYTDFVSALVSKPAVRLILPVTIEEVEKSVETLGTNNSTAPSNNLPTTSYTFEPGYDVLMSKLVEKIARAQVYQMILESSASEQSSRMMAMKNASEAAGEMIDDLTLAFNKARQAAITKEISEISAGMASIS